MPNKIRTVLGRAARSYVLFVALGLVIGLTLAPVAWQAADSKGTVAVVPVSGTITGGAANEYGAVLQEARQDSDVKAVVLVINSGGGSASASEAMYLHTKRTAREMPVVTSVGSGANSGAYYTAAPSDRIYVKPASVVGSVGTVATAPGDTEPNNIIATTGPDKLSGGDQREFHSIVETLGNSFYNAVEESRGDRLELSRTELAEAQLYAGSQAVENGMADAIGGRQAAIAHAAEEAGMDDYDVEVLRPDGPSLFLSRSNYLAADVPNKQMIDPSYLIGDGDGGPVFLMVPGSYLSESDDGTASASVVANRNGSAPAARLIPPTGVPGA